MSTRSIDIHNVKAVRILYIFHSKREYHPDCPKIAKKSNL